MAKTNKDKEAGFAILNSLPGAKPTVQTLDEHKKAERLEVVLDKVREAKTDDDWLSIFNDALFQ